jgi:hypothetical protein
MNKKNNYLDILINSCKIEVASSTTATEKIGINFYRNKNNNILIFIGHLKKETEDKCLNDLDIISKEEIFLRLSKGCVAPSSIGYMLESLNEYHDESVTGDISAFLQSLEVSKIILSYTGSMGGAKAALVILHKICQEINVECIPIILKPALFKGASSHDRDFKDLLAYIDKHKYHIYDEDLSLYGRDLTDKSFNLNNFCEIELLKFANSIIRSV